MYADKSAKHDGITRVELHVRPRTGKSNLKVTGKGPLLDDPTFPLVQPVTVQLHGGSACWEGTHSAPALKNDAGPARRFTDRAD